MAREPRERRDREERDSEFTDKLVHINRVAKVVKGGRRFGFAALVVVGDEKGRVGFGHGKAREVPEAIRKATEAAKRTLIRVPLREGRTLHHDVAGRHGAGRVFLRAAPPGTGIIAGGPMRAVFETLGMQDVVAKSLGSSNPYNVVRATFDALKHQDSPRSVASRRNIKVSTLQARRREGGRREEREPSEFIDKLVHINRVAKVVKGGRRFAFAALVVVGDQKGRAGFGHGKAREVPEAIRKATESAKRNLTRVALREGRTLHHDIAGRHGAGRVYLRAAPAGTGIIAGGPMRAVFESLGMQDVVAKSKGSSNPYNMVRATFDALKHQDSPRSVAARRNIKVSTLQSRRVGGDAEVSAD